MKWFRVISSNFSNLVIQNSGLALHDLWTASPLTQNTCFKGKGEVNISNQKTIMIDLPFSIDRSRSLIIYQLSSASGSLSACRSMKNIVIDKDELRLTSFATVKRISWYAQVNSILNHIKSKKSRDWPNSSTNGKLIYETVWATCSCSCGYKISKEFKCDRNTDGLKLG